MTTIETVYIEKVNEFPPTRPGRPTRFELWCRRPDRAQCDLVLDDFEFKHDCFRASLCQEAAKAGALVTVTYHETPRGFLHLTGVKLTAQRRTLSYEAWRREVANGTMADWDEDKGRYVDAVPSGFRWCCYDRMVTNPPTKPHQHCRNGHPLQWYDPNDPERGWFDCDEEGT